MSKAATAAVEHHHDLIRNGDPEFFRELPVAHVLWPGDLHFQIMIPATECTDLIVAAFDCAVADFRCEVFLPAKIVFDTPARPLLHQIPKLAMRQFEKSVRADPSRDALEKAIDDFFQPRLHVIQRELRSDQAHAAVDVKPDPARRNHTASMHVHGCHAADRKSITAVAVSHAQRVARDAWQGRDVADLLINGFIHFAHQFFCGDDSCRHAHTLFVTRRQFPNCV